MPRTITSIQGQAWDEIARQTYGTESQMDRLLAANPELATLDTLPGGKEITVPDLPETDRSTGPAAPWSR